MASRKACAQTSFPQKSGFSGTPKVKVEPRGAGEDAASRLHTSFSSGACATANTSAASSQVRAKMDTQSSEGQAGTTPLVESRPWLGLRPTRLFSAAGTRPEPAVSVPRLKLT